MKTDVETIYAIVRKIPRGRVATYGHIARLSGHPGHARQVGHALSVLRDQRVPWFRVVNSKGEISVRSGPPRRNPQRETLEAEGVVFRGDRIVLKQYGWKE